MKDVTKMKDGLTKKYKYHPAYKSMRDNNHSCAVLYVANQQITHESYLNCNENTLFNIGSIAKFFIGRVIHYLVDNKYLSLTHYVNMYLDDFPMENVRIKDLLFHESGLVNYYSLFQENQYRTITNDKALRRVYDTPLSFSPGKRFEYSNTNYIVLYEIIKHIMKEPYIETLKRVLKTTSNDIREYANHVERRDKLVMSFVDNNQFDNDTLTLGDGGLLASIQFFNEYFRNTTFYLDPLHHNSLNDSITEHYEYGYTYDDTNQLMIHSGAYMGYRCLMAIKPSTNEDVIILSNSDYCTMELRQFIMNELLHLN